MNPERMCDGKVQYAHRRDAKRHRRKNFSWRSQHIYRCDYCGKFHLGHDRLEQMLLLALRIGLQ